MINDIIQAFQLVFIISKSERLQAFPRSIIYEIYKLLVIALLTESIIIHC